MVRHLLLPWLIFIEHSILFTHLKRPFWLDQLIDFPTLIMWVLILEQIEILVLEYLISAQRKLGFSSLQIIDLILKPLDLLLGLLREMTHIARIIVDYDLVVRRHESWWPNRVLSTSLRKVMSVVFWVWWTLKTWLMSLLNPGVVVAATVELVELVWILEVVWNLRSVPVIIIIRVRLLLSLASRFKFGEFCRVFKHLKKLF